MSEFRSQTKIGIEFSAFLVQAADRLHKTLTESDIRLEGIDRIKVSRTPA